MPKFEGVLIQRVRKQHTSTIVVVPKLVRLALDIKAGDYLVFASHSSIGTVELSKFVPGESGHGKSTRGSDRKTGSKRKRVTTGDKRGGNR